MTQPRFAYLIRMFPQASETFIANEIMRLEELGLPYTTRLLTLSKLEQKQEWFLKVNPNGRIPAIIDHDAGNFAVFESGAILIYLAEKTGKLLPDEPRARSRVLQWLMFQMGGVGPMFGQTHHFLRAAKEQVPYAIERFGKETRRLYGVLDGHLKDHACLAGEYSIADVATYPWVARHEWHKVDLNDFPGVKRWFDAISARPAVKKGMDVPPAAR